eukprot:m.27243 g.27243  ORF g.27243 m.27243 type:complete len:376 (-) comp15711_c0_seq1:129-1256(-)
MRFYVGDETGLLKRLQITSDEENGGAKCVVTKWRKQDRAQSITAMHLRALDPELPDDGEELVIGLKSGIVETFNPDKDLSPVSASMTSKNSPIIGIFGDDSRIIAAHSSGDVTVHNRKSKKGKSTSIAAGPDATCMQVCGDATHKFGIAGTEYDPRIWDLNNVEAPLFKAKNVKPDKLLLQEARAVNALCFVPGTDGMMFVTGTILHKLRLYDTRAQHRPMYSVEIGDNAIKSLSVSPDGTNVVVGDVIGDLFSCDLRTGKTLGKFRGLTGSCRNVHFHPSEKRSLVATCGLDRHVRLFDAKTRRGKFSQYLKQSLTCMTFANSGYGNEFETVKKDPKGKQKRKVNKEEQDEEDDELWSSLDNKGKKNKTSKDNH